MKHLRSGNSLMPRKSLRGSTCYILGLLILPLPACNSTAPEGVTIKKSSSQTVEQRSDDASSEKPYGSSTSDKGSDSSGIKTDSTPVPPVSPETESVSVPGIITGAPGDGKEPEPGQILRNGVYLIKSQYSKKCIRVPESKREDFVKLLQYDCDNSADFKWRVEYMEHKYYSFTNIGTGKSIQLVDQMAVNEAFIEQASYNAQSFQMWNLTKNADMSFLIKSRDSDKLCLDVAFGSLANNAPLQLWKDCNGIGQRWMIVPVF